MADLPLCIDCRHHIRQHARHLCTHATAVAPLLDPVTGAMAGGVQDCSAERGGWAPSGYSRPQCGRSGIFYEARGDGVG